MTYSYEFWFDVVRWGRYTHEIKRLHQIYGPIIRINPDELHCNDPSFIETIYAGGHRKTDKPLHFVRAFPPSAHKTGVGTVNHGLHRLRRGAINKFFSKTQICNLESLVHHNSQRLCDRLLDHNSKESFRIIDPYSCFASDVITEYCFGESFQYLDQPTWEPNYRTALNILFGYIHIFRHFPLIAYLIEAIPLFIVTQLSSKAGHVMKDLKVAIPERIRRTESISPTVAYASQATIFSSMLESDLPPSEKDVSRLAAEANVLLIGGTQSTSVALEFVTYQLLARLPIAERLREEISLVAPDPKALPSWRELEKLPYFSAVILETLRLIYGSPGRLSRIATDQDLYFSDTLTAKSGKKQVEYIIPKGYAIGMSAFITHMDEAIFPSPKAFDPERWMGRKGEVDRTLERYLLTFSRGSRNCVGMQLAYCELYICIAALVLRVLPSMRLHETNDLDVEYDHDELVGRPRPDREGVRVKMM